MTDDFFSTKQSASDDVLLGNDMFTDDELDQELEDTDDDLEDDEDPDSVIEDPYDDQDDL